MTTTDAFHTSWKQTERELIGASRETIQARYNAALAERQKTTNEIDYQRLTGIIRACADAWKLV